MRYLAYAMLLIVVAGFTACKYKQNNELSIDDAVSIAKRVVTSKNIDVGKFDVEALKVKSKYEKGPIRLTFVARFFPKEKYKWLLDNEYWIVYFYSKGGLDKPDRLGGEEFYVLVDLHTGKVIGSFKLG